MSYNDSFKKTFFLKNQLCFGLFKNLFKAGLEQSRAHLCPCTYRESKSSLMYTKKRVRKLFLS